MRISDWSSDVCSSDLISKPMNLGALMRSAHAFGASFFFTVEAAFNAKEAKLADTSDAAKHLPLYTYSAVAELALPRGCALVGVELTEDAVELPSFYPPQAAAYVLGRESSEERRVGKECVSTCRSRWSPDN